MERPSSNRVCLKKGSPEISFPTIEAISLYHAISSISHFWTKPNGLFRDNGRPLPAGRICEIEENSLQGRADLKRGRTSLYVHWRWQTLIWELTVRMPVIKFGNYLDRKIPEKTIKISFFLSYCNHFPQQCLSGSTVEEVTLLLKKTNSLVKTEDALESDGYLDSPCTHIKKKSYVRPFLCLLSLGVGLQEITIQLLNYSGSSCTSTFWMIMRNISETMAIEIFTDLIEIWKNWP